MAILCARASSGRGPLLRWSCPCATSCSIADSIAAPVIWLSAAYSAQRLEVRRVDTFEQAVEERQRRHREVTYLYRVAPIQTGIGRAFPNREKQFSASPATSEVERRLRGCSAGPDDSSRSRCIDAKSESGVSTWHHDAGRARSSTGPVRRPEGAASTRPREPAWCPQSQSTSLYWGQTTISACVVVCNALMSSPSINCLSHISTLTSAHKRSA